jgi:hypothetical protein
MHRRRFSMEAEVRLPKPPPPPISPSAFLLCPAVWSYGLTPEQWLWQQWVYHCAFVQAQAIVRPSLPERDLLAVWN